MHPTVKNRVRYFILIFYTHSNIFNGLNVGANKRNILVYRACPSYGILDNALNVLVLE